MSRYRCDCGHFWADLTGKSNGFILSDNFEMMDTMATDTFAFCVACQNGERKKWIADYFDAPYPTDLPNAEIVSGIFHRVTNKNSAGVFHYPRCQLITMFEENRWVRYERAKED